MLMSQADNSFEILGSDYSARRIRWGVKDDRFGLRRDRSLNHLRGDAKVLFLFALDQNDLAACVLNDVLERDPIGDRKNNLIAVVNQNLNSIEESQLAAGGEDTFVRRIVRAEVTGVTIHDCLAYLRNTGHVCVAGEVLLDRLDCRVLDVAWCGEVRFAGTEVRK